MSGKLQFERWGAFRDTFQPYRVWTLWLDVPGLDLRRGDQVFEVGPGTRDGGFDKKPLWDGYRFQARRPQEGECLETIRELEDWQAAGLFGGELPPWPLEGVALQQIRSALMDITPAGKECLASIGAATEIMIMYMMKTAPALATEPAQTIPPGSPAALAYLRSLVPTSVFCGGGQGGHHRAALIATEDLSGTPIRQNDIVLVLSGAGNPEPTGTRGRRIRVPRSALATVADQLDSLDALELSSNEPHWIYSVASMESTLRVMQRPTWKDATSPLLIVRPLVAPVSEPIEAASDEGAVFELLAQVAERTHEEGAP